MPPTPSPDETSPALWRQLTLGGLSALALVSVAVVGWQVLPPGAKRYLRNFTGGTVSDFPAEQSVHTRSGGPAEPPPAPSPSVVMTQPGQAPAKPVSRATELTNRVSSGPVSLTPEQMNEGAVDIVPPSGLGTQVKVKLPGGLTQTLPVHVRLPPGVHFLEFTHPSPSIGQSSCQVQVPPRGHVRVKYLGKRCAVESDPQD